MPDTGKEPTKHTEEDKRTWGMLIALAVLVVLSIVAGLAKDMLTTL